MCRRSPRLSHGRPRLAEAIARRSALTCQLGDLLRWEPDEGTAGNLGSRRPDLCVSAQTSSESEHHAGATARYRQPIIPSSRIRVRRLHGATER